MEMFEYIDEMKQPYDIFYTDCVHSELHWHYYSEVLYIVSGSAMMERRFSEKGICAIYIRCSSTV